MEPGSTPPSSPQSQPAVIVHGSDAHTLLSQAVLPTIQPNILTVPPQGFIATVDPTSGGQVVQDEMISTSVVDAQPHVIMSGVPAVSTQVVSSVNQEQANSLLQCALASSATQLPSQSPVPLPSVVAGSASMVPNPAPIISSSVPVVATSTEIPAQVVYQSVPQVHLPSTSASPARLVRPPQTVRVHLQDQQRPAQILTNIRTRVPVAAPSRPKSVGATISLSSQQVVQPLDLKAAKDACLQKIRREAQQVLQVKQQMKMASPAARTPQPLSLRATALGRPRATASVGARHRMASPRLVTPAQVPTVHRSVTPTATPLPRPSAAVNPQLANSNVQKVLKSVSAQPVSVEAAAKRVVSGQPMSGVTLVDGSQLPGAKTEYIAGKEYYIRYGSQKVVCAVWDGEFFKVKSEVEEAAATTASCSPAQSPAVVNNTVCGGGKLRKVLTRGLNNGVMSAETAAQSTSAATLLNGKLLSPSNLARSPIRPQPLDKEPTNTPTASQAVAQAAPTAAQAAAQATPEAKPPLKRPLRAAEEGKFAVCTNCGNMSANYNVCDGCNKDLPDNVKYFVPHPEKTPSKVMKLNSGENPLNSKQFYGRVVKALPKKRPGKVLKKPAEPEMVTILSSDDEDEASSRVSQGTPLANNSRSTKETTEGRQNDNQNGQTVPPSPQVTETAVTSSTEIKMKLRQVRIGTLRSKEVEPMGVSSEQFQIRFTSQANQKFNMVLTTTEITKIDACINTKSSTLFLHTTGICGSKIRQGCKLLPGKEPYFDPSGSAESHKYIILIVDELSKSSVMTFRQICQLIGDENGKKGFLNEMSTGETDQRLIACLMEESTSTALSKSALQVAKTRSSNQFILPTAFSLLVPSKDGNLQLVLPSALANNNGADTLEEGEEEEVMDRSRSPSPYQAAFNAPIIPLFTYPPPPATGGITVTNEDLFCLNEGEFLNDVIIDFYLKFVFTEMLTPEQQQKTHLFSSFFYRRLTQKQTKRQSEPANLSLPERRHSRVKTWTRHVDLFSKDYVIVPINESAHWYLAIICFPWLQKPVTEERPKEEPADQSNSQNEAPESSDGAAEAAASEKPKKAANSRSQKSNSLSTYVAKQPSILIFDSLSGLGRSGVVRTLREYIQVEWNTKKEPSEGPRTFDKDNMRGTNPKCPQQTNFSDCGIYVLLYVESFFRNPIQDYAIPLKNLLNWFEESEAKQKRSALRTLILQLKADLNPDVEYDPTKDGCLPLEAVADNMCSDDA